MTISGGSAIGTVPPQGRGLRALVVPSITTALMLLLLIGLGTWQIQRMHWKLSILDAIDRAEALPAIPLPANPTPYAKVRVTGTLRNDLESLYGAEGRDTRAGPEMGGALIVPLERPGQSTLLIDRGWIPAAALGHIPGPTGQVDIDGYVRPADMSGTFSAKDNGAKHLFYTLNPPAIAAALGIGPVAPFTLVAMGPTPPTGAPDPAKTLPRPPNNHLTYAITWFGLAITLLVIFAVYARRALLGEKD